MPSPSIIDDIDAYRAWDKNTRPIFERLERAVQQFPVDERNRQKLGKHLITLRDELLAAQKAMVGQMDDRLMLVIRFERYVNTLEGRVAELESDCQAWQREYEPDADPDRRAFFSNVRQAIAVLCIGELTLWVHTMKPSGGDGSPRLLSRLSFCWRASLWFSGGLTRPLKPHGATGIIGVVIGYWLR
jgi:hypothetical protein